MLMIEFYVAFVVPSIIFKNQLYRRSPWRYSLLINSEGAEMASKPKESTQEVITAYKGFDKDMKCRGYQYEIGGEYQHDGKVEACASGFHACEYPLDVFSYYPPARSLFAVVEQSGKLARHDDDSKVASEKITIKASIDLPGIIRAAIEYTTSRCKPIDPESPASSTGYQGAASSTGVRGAASSTGKHSVALAAGYGSRAMAAETGAIVCVYNNDSGELIHIRASKVGDNGIKPNTWYSLDESGEFVEVQP